VQKPEQDREFHLDWTVRGLSFIKTSRGCVMVVKSGRHLSTNHQVLANKQK